MQSALLFELYVAYFSGTWSAAPASATTCTKCCVFLFVYASPALAHGLLSSVIVHVALLQVRFQHLWRVFPAKVSFEKLAIVQFIWSFKHRA